MDHKSCFKCNRVLPMDSFYSHRRMADGHLNKCKECAKRDVSEHRIANIGRVHEYDRWRHQNHPWRKENFVDRQRRLRQSGDPKAKARQMVGNAVRDGRLIRQPCEVCGTIENVEAHHDDYGRPLDVRWLCFKHHREVGHGQIVTAPNRTSDHHRHGR